MVAGDSASASLGSGAAACRAASEPPRPSSVAGSLPCPTIPSPEADEGTISALSGRDVPVVGAVQQAPPSTDEMLEGSDKPVLVDSYVTWCGPSQYLMPVLDQVGAILQCKMQIVKMDTRMEKVAANEYHVEAVPEFTRDGKPCDPFEEAMSITQFMQRLKGAAGDQ